MIKKEYFIPVEDSEIKSLLIKGEIEKAEECFKILHPKEYKYTYNYACKDVVIKPKSYASLLEAQAERLRDFPVKQGRKQAYNLLNSREKALVCCEKGFNSFRTGEGASFESEEELLTAIAKSDIFTISTIVIDKQYQTEAVFKAILQLFVREKAFYGREEAISSLFTKEFKSSAIYQQGMAMATGRIHYVTNEKFLTPKLYQYMLEHLIEYKDMYGSKADYFETLPVEYQTRENALLCCRAHDYAIRELSEEYQNREFYLDLLKINPSAIQQIPHLEYLDESDVINALLEFKKGKNHNFSIGYGIVFPKKFLESYDVCLALAEIKDGYKYIPSKMWDDKLIRTALMLGNASLNEEFIPKKVCTRELYILNWEEHPYYAYRETPDEFLQDDSFWMEIFKLPEIGKQSPVPEHLLTDEIADRLTLEGGFKNLPKNFQTDDRILMYYKQKNALVEDDLMTENASVLIYNEMSEEEKEKRAKDLFKLPYDIAKDVVLPARDCWGWIYKYKNSDIVLKALKEDSENIKKIDFETYLELTELGFFESESGSKVEEESIEESSEIFIPFEIKSEPDIADQTYEQLSLFDFISC